MMVRVLSTVDPLLWQDEVYMSTYSIIDSAPSYTDYCVRPTNQSHENALFSLWDCKECSFEPRFCSESQLTRSREVPKPLTKDLLDIQSVRSPDTVSILLHTCAYHTLGK